MRVMVLDADVTARYLLHLRGVTRFRLDRSDGQPWNYAELTEIWVEDHGEGRTVEVVLWSEPSGIFAECSAVEVIEGG